LKKRIFQILQHAGPPVSGEYLSRQLGISRVAVWKHIRGMQAAGYDIQSSPKGYQMTSFSDTPHSWVFGDRSHQVHHFHELPSTMEKAVSLARAGCENFNVVVADRQTRGRGRLQRSWQSDQGGLYFTMVLRPRMAPWAAPLLNLAASLDLAETLTTLYAIDAKVKWPNDVLADDQKIAGILSQMATEADCIHYLCLGIGVNVNNHPSDVSQPAVSVTRLTGKSGSRAKILDGFMDRFERRISEDRLSDVVQEWKLHTLTLGRRVVIQTTRETIEGIAVDLDAMGGLVLSLPDGRKRTVVHGDCFHGAVIGKNGRAMSATN
jgi:BirA family transcriptional regulator, biotin operon repressor / biotin---[acetyl-CoA-carboxylase] ligase